MIDPLYNLLRHLTSPIVAITTSAGGRRNGMIANSAQRASLVPSLPRVSVYISKTNFSHDLVYSSGLLGLHLLRGDQYDVIARGLLGVRCLSIAARRSSVGLSTQWMPARRRFFLRTSWESRSRRRMRR